LVASSFLDRFGIGGCGEERGGVGLELLAELIDVQVGVTLPHLPQMRLLPDVLPIVQE
jgi:hypothetical protein